MHTPAQPKIQLDGVHCKITIQRFEPQIVVLTISGTDVGEFGDVPMMKLTELAVHSAPIQLFIDARNVRGASIEVSGEWARWLAANKARLRRASMLPGSRFVEITAEFVRRFAELQGVMRIYTDPAGFDVDVAEAVRGN